MTVTAARRPVSAAWWRLPFTAEPWRRTAFVLLAPPAALVALADGGGLQRRLAARLLGREVRATRLRGLATLPFGLLALAVTGYAWAIAALNLAYPARWPIGMGGSYHDAWGGPTFAGVWAFHAIVGGVPFLFLTPWILRGLTSVQTRLLGA